MKRLNTNDLIKLAANSSRARKTLSEMMKVSNKSNTEFNENVPSMSQDEAAYQDAGNQQQQMPQEQVPPGQEMSAMPMEQTPPAPEGPEAIGARAAQSFLGPEVMQAAMSGDPNAADIIARTAGQVAGAASEAALKAVPDASQMGAAGVPAEGGVPGEGAMQGSPAIPAAPATPEQDLANEIVPPAQAQAQAAPEEQAPPGQEQGNMDQGKSGQTQALPTESAGPVPAGNKEEGGEKVDLKTVAKLIQAAKSGRI